MDWLQEVKQIFESLAARQPHEAFLAVLAELMSKLDGVSALDFLSEKGSLSGKDQVNL